MELQQVVLQVALQLPVVSSTTSSLGVATASFVATVSSVVSVYSVASIIRFVKLPPISTGSVSLLSGND